MILAWSGGKDSALALWKLQRDGVEVDALVTTVTTEYDRISMHGIRRSVLELQAAAVGVPVHVAPLAPGASNDEYERSFIGALHTVHPSAAVAFGDLFLADVRAYRETMLGPTGRRTVFPLWGSDTAALAREFVDAGFRAVLCCVDTEQLDAEFAGREFDHALLRDLSPSVDPCGERGEFHTCVYDGPIFRAPVRIERGDRVRRDGRFEYCDLIPIPGGSG